MIVNSEKKAIVIEKIDNQTIPLKLYLMVGILNLTMV